MTPENCTCYCTRCWLQRVDCECPEGPTGPPASSCPEHSWQGEEGGE